MKIKNNYAAPEAEVIELRLDANVMAANSPGSPDLDGDEEMGDIG